MQILTRELPAHFDQNYLADISSPLLRQIYARRGVASPEEVTERLSALLTPEQLPDIDKAAVRLADAIMGGEKIVVVGDFDADGATSVALCMCVLAAFGAREPDFVVPNRFEFGYGLSPEIVDLVAPRSPNLIVTVDNGVASIEGVARACEQGIDVVVTDHHLPGRELPQAVAIVNPNLEGCTFGSPYMAGVGVAYYLLSVTRTVLRERDWFTSIRPEPNLAQYLDLVALGTVADVVPLDTNNRLLVHHGLRRMRAGKCLPGIRALIEVAKRPISTLTAQDLGFGVGPRLNAAGRLDDMTLGIRCLLAPDLHQARKLATALDELNKTRRALEGEMVADAQLMLEQAQFSDEQVGLSVYHPTFHQGVVGIVAGRLREKYHKPAIAFADAGDTAPDELKGSARSIDGLHIRDVLDYIANQYPGLLSKFGGHAMAAGLSIKRVHFERFQTVFDKAVQRFTNADMFQARIVTDGVLSPTEMNLENAQLLSQAGPWGNGFPEPAFEGEFVLVNQRVVGGDHLKMVLKAETEHGQQVIDAIAFRQSPLPGGTARVRMVYKLSVNDYREWPTLQLMVEYLEPLP
ncbi:MAG: single-stranded-DNA-specific exonuclease RecJ [Pseudomonadota bacterium]